METERGECVEEEKEGGQSIFGAIMMSICQIPWMRWLFFYRNNTDSSS